MKEPREPREIKELLEELKEFIETSNNIFGICACTPDMTISKIITPKEASILNHYFVKNLPDTECTFGYCWEVGEKEPRIKWLNEQINNYEK